MVTNGLGTAEPKIHRRNISIISAFRPLTLTNAKMESAAITTKYGTNFCQLLN